MYISTNWIKDFVDLDGIDIKKVINKFTLSTAEVEGIIEYGKNTKDIVVAEVISVDNVENSKKLHALVVDTGKEKLNCICGAPNVKKGIKVAFAKEGSLVQGIKIEKTTIAGYESCGMCLSEKELGISDDHSGILVFNENTKVGTDVKEIIPVDDIVFEVDNKSLTNRPDLWGHYGIAREIAAITKRKLKPLEVENLEKYDDLEKLNINIEAKDLCLRYSALTVENVTKKQASYKMKTRLYYCGLRSKSLLVDMTNYIMLELGQPMHAFDKEFIKSINVKTLDHEEEFVTLDDIKRKLPKDTMMICNENTPVAIAGVMGGQNTEITDSTTSLFLESANFDAVKVRKTASTLALRTDASARYEKTLDPSLTKIAVERFVKVLKDEDSKVKVTSRFSDEYVKEYPEITIDISREYINKKIGVNLALEEIIDTLIALEFKVEVKDNENMHVTVPSFRATKDVSGKADIIEEISRIYGYDNIIPQTKLCEVVPVREDKSRKLEYSAKEILALKYGLSEIHSYVWYDTKENAKLGIETHDNLKIINGLNRQDSVLRYNMGPTILCAIEKNIKNYDEIGIFEIGRTFEYNFDGKDCTERKILGIGISSVKSSEKELLVKLKSMIDSITKVNKNITLNYVENNVVDYNFVHPVNSFILKSVTENIGYVTVINPIIKDKINKKSNIVLAEIDMDKLSQIEEEKVMYKEISKYQAVDFDLSITVDKNSNYSDIESVILNADLKYLQEYSLVDIYEDEEKLRDKKNVTINFKLASYDSTLTKEKIDLERDNLITALKSNNMIVAI